ncbi:MAG: hypothetical protein KF708_17305 [Pirellulales bacterium]|nr:hypothetical protein [Pirellulales bacterium]
MSHVQGLPNESEIERIVRDVLARLQGNGAAEKQAPAVKAEEPNDNGERLVLHERVVSVATIVDRLTNKRAVVVPATAIVTPATRDLLWDRGISLVRQAPRKPPAQLGLRRVVGVAETNDEPTGLLAGLKEEVQQVSRVGLVGVVDEIVDQVARGGAIGVLFTDAADAALCLANRTSGVRAVLARSANLARQARASLAANLFVIEPKGKSLFELRQIVVATTAPAGHSLGEGVKQRLV